MRWLSGLGLFVLAIVQQWHHYVFEFLRTFIFYDPASHMLKDAIAGISPAMFVDYGFTAALVLGAGAILWPSRPDFLRSGSPLTLTLPRDSGSDLLGIQTFDGINYIQVQVSSSRRAEECQAAILASDFDVGGGNFANEYNERIICPWSKRGEPKITISPADGPHRITVLVYTALGLHGEVGTPTNWLPRLQRIASIV